MGTRDMAAEVAGKVVESLKVKADEGEEDEEEEDLVDPAMGIKEKCGEEHCSMARAALDDGSARVTSKTRTSETCLEEIVDFYHCVDHCAAPDIFKHLK